MFAHREAGTTLVDLLTVLAVGSVMLVATVSYSLPWMARQTMRSDQHVLAGFLQLAKIESVSRNRPCRFVLDTASGEYAVWDSQGTSSTNDDELLHDGLLSTAVSFERPDTGSAVTLQALGAAGQYQVVFTSDGTVQAGTGDVFLRGGNDYGRISAHAAGGIELSRWDGNSWTAGS